MLRLLLYDVMKRTDDWALAFAYSRLLEGTDEAEACKVNPPVHYLEGGHDFGLRANCPWHFHPLIKK
ncbi:MAG TPA: hypothetical protein DC049_06390 [Spirochaetia bacterium]|nr:hypothetical protein [Spirochaetia bacterium]